MIGNYNACYIDDLSLSNFNNCWKSALSFVYLLLNYERFAYILMFFFHRSTLLMYFLWYFKIYLAPCYCRGELCLCENRHNYNIKYMWLKLCNILIFEVMFCIQVLSGYLFVFTILFKNLKPLYILFHSFTLVPGENCENYYSIY